MLVLGELHLVAIIVVVVWVLYRVLLMRKVFIIAHNANYAWVLKIAIFGI